MEKKTEQKENHLLFHKMFGIIRITVAQNQMCKLS